jgi:small subunit ribosomal protein S18
VQLSPPAPGPSLVRSPITPSITIKESQTTNPRPPPDSSPSSFTSPASTTPHAPRANFNPRPRTLSPGNERASQNLLSLIDRTAQRKERQRTQRTAAHAGGNSAEDLARHKTATRVTKQISRRWKTGDVYAPHDLSEVEMKKWKQRGKPAVDVFDVLELDPLVEYRVSVCPFSRDLGVI